MQKFIVHNSFSNYPPAGRVPHIGNHWLTRWRVARDQHSHITCKHHSSVNGTLTEWRVWTWPGDVTARIKECWGQSMVPTTLQSGLGKETMSAFVNFNEGITNKRHLMWVSISFSNPRCFLQMHWIWMLMLWENCLPSPCLFFPLA